ncbi:protein obstructor-E [Bactrocera neohumeralis]|uniref:protein obstructor-E n=1 Tax=Bactrocera tryoni TaxID=59916 RepID=UPI001A985C32|nr:protein obstructor-E [Bactrocera tryoni]XP_050328165.1 protein obstructor-E [Bactrocera neohumeralis]
MQQKGLSILLVLFGVIAQGHGGPIQTSECPEKIGEQAYAHTERCDQFFLCTNGTLTLETCENGLLFDGKGSVHNHCNYNWAVDCKGRKWDPTPITTPGCDYQFGIYPVSKECTTTYIKCAFGEPIEQECDAGLAYDDRIHGCNWPDQLLDICNPEAVVGFKCPTKVDSGSPAARFWPFPRFPVQGDCHRLITCVEGYPRLITCGEDKVFDENTLTCEDAEYASSKCNNFGK